MGQRSKGPGFTRDSSTRRCTTASSPSVTKADKEFMRMVDRAGGGQPARTVVKYLCAFFDDSTRALALAFFHRPRGVVRAHAPFHPGGSILQAASRTPQSCEQIYILVDRQAKSQEILIEITLQQSLFKPRAEHAPAVAGRRRIPMLTPRNSHRHRCPAPAAPCHPSGSQWRQAAR